MDGRRDYYEDGEHFVELEGKVDGQDVYASFFFENGWTLNRLEIDGYNVAPSKHTETIQEIAKRNGINW